MNTSRSTPLERVRGFYASDIRLSLKIIATSLAVIAVTVLPLLLYAVLGPGDGNPRTLGFIALLGMLLGQVGLAAGFLRMLWEFFTGRH